MARQLEKGVWRLWLRIEKSGKKCKILQEYKQNSYDNKICYGKYINCC